MSNYYYLASQLPILLFGQQPVFGRKEFLEQARKWLSEKEFKVLARANLDRFELDRNDNDLLKKYKEFEYILRTELAQTRRGEKVSEGRITQGIVGKNPLEAEKELLSLRWQTLEDLESGHCFDLEFFLIYHLKLQVLGRMFEFDKEKGTEVFDKLCEMKIEL